ncbi:MAG TPA: hypothetical protein VHB01_02285 [Nitrosospira sp.]|nr:hypothetical protein [Nitrosospira sp.]
MRNKKTAISLAVGSAFAATLGIAPAVSAAENTPENLFAARSLDKGYVLAYADRVDPNKYGGGAPKTSSEGRCGMSIVDANKDGKVTKQEFLKHHEAIFDRIDANKDGAVDQPEADAYGGARSSGANVAPHGAMKK